MKLGIRPELIEPASPQQNARHERVHRTLMPEATKPAYDTGPAVYVFAQTPQPHNEGDFAALGRIIKGMDVVDRMEPGDYVKSVRVLKPGEKQAGRRPAMARAMQAGHPDCALPLTTWCAPRFDRGSCPRAWPRTGPGRHSWSAC